MLVIEGAIRESMSLNHELNLLADRYYKHYKKRVLKLSINFLKKYLYHGFFSWLIYYDFLHAYLYCIMTAG